MTDRTHSPDHPDAGARRDHGAQSERSTEHLQGHWVLARAGKRVLRPGGREMTERLLVAASPRGRRVVEIAPGLGLTAGQILEMQPTSYVALERDTAIAERARAVIGSRGVLVEGEASKTGLPEASADLVIGEAMLTMQSEATKRAILAEVHRVLAPGGRYAVHELGLRPDDLPSEVKDDVRRALATAIKVNARPLTMVEWTSLFESEGFDVEWQTTGAMALLEPRRVLADEGPAGVARMLLTMARDGAVRRRILTMRSTFARHRDHLCAVGIVVRRRGEEPTPG